MFTAEARSLLVFLSLVLKYKSCEETSYLNCVILLLSADESYYLLIT